MADEYKRSCEDELTWSDVEQLHAATLQIGNTCFEYKKLCVVFLAAAITYLAKLEHSSVDGSLFVIASVIIFGFWIADSTAYYYQRVVRRVMDEKKIEIAQRNGISDYLREATTISRLSALFNGSITLYYALFTLNICGFWLYEVGWMQGQI